MNEELTWIGEEGAGGRESEMRNGEDEVIL